MEAKTSLEKYRLLQSRYRLEVLQLTPPQYPNGSHQLKPEDAQKGFNFISSEAHLYAVKRSKSWRVFVNRERVTGNLISSQALCFNLFTDLKMGILKKDPEAVQVVKSMFPRLAIEKVVSLDIEKLPRIAGFKKLATCFDAVIVFKDAQGLESLIGIEVKYLEGLDEKRAGRGQKWHALAQAFGVFNQWGLQAYPPQSGFNQIARNFLLAMAYARYPQKKVYSFTLGLSEDQETRAKVRQFKNGLKKPFQAMVQFVSLEEFVRQGHRGAGGRYRELLEKFKTRYFFQDNF